MKHEWDRMSLVLHIVMALCVSIQVVSLILYWVHPLSSRAFILTHEYNGMLTFVVALLMFGNKLLDDNKVKMQRLFPYNAQGRQDIKEDIQSLLARRLPVRAGGGLAGMVQGLGLLLLLGLGFFGTCAFICWTTPIGLSSWGHPLIDVHEFLGNILWWYLAGHVGMATVHRLLPQRFLREIS